MTAGLTDPGRTRGGLYRIREVYHTHRDFVLLLGLFAVLQFMLLFFFAPGGRFGDYSDFWYYLDMASRLDSGYYPFIHYWVEYPPLFPWLPVGAYWLSRLLPPAPHPELWFYMTFGGLMGLFGVGNLVMVYLLGLRLYDRQRALRCATFYALLFGPIFVHAGWFDGAALFFMLLSLYLLFRNRSVLSGVAAGVGAMIKVLPLALVPVGFKLLSRRWRYLAGLGVTLVVTNLPFLLLNPALFLASWRALLAVPSWETLWALLDGYYSYGLAVGNRFDPAEAGGGLRPEFVPWSVVLAVFGVVYSLLYLLPWQLRPADRSPTSRRSWLRSVLDHFRQPVIGQGKQAVDRVGTVAFVGLSLNLFMIFSKGWSPQFVLWYLPFLVLTMPNGWGLTYITLLTICSVVERIIFFFVLPDSHWLLSGTVLFRTALMLILIPEFLAVMGFLPLSLWKKIRRWGLLAATVAMAIVLALGTGAFVRDYRQQSYVANPQRHVVERIQASALPGDGVVATSREAFDALEPFLADQEVRLYTRDDGEFRPAAFKALWLEFMAGHPRVWLLLDYTGGQNADWNAHLADLLAQDGYQTIDEWVGPEQRLVHYAASAPTAIRIEDVDADFGGEVKLLRIELDSEPLAGGEVLRLQLRWQQLQELEVEPQVFLHLVSNQGKIRAQRDVPLHLGEQAGGVGLLLPLDLEPGAYYLRVGVYDAATGDRLLLPSGEDSVTMGGSKSNEQEQRSRIGRAAHIRRA